MRRLVFKRALAVLVCAALPASARAQVESSTRTSTRASEAPGAGEEGPRLELEGLELEQGAPGAPAKTGAGPKEEPEPDFFASLSARAAGIVDRTTLGGYGEHSFSAGGGEISTFQNNRYVLFVYSQISERISTATEIEFEFGGSPMKKDGNLGFGEVLLEFAVVDFELWDWLVLRAGVILVPFGSLNLRHDSPTWDLSDRPIAYTTVVPSTWFESGAGFLGTIELGMHQRLSYELYVVNGLDARIFDGLGLRAARGSHFSDNNHDKAFVGRLAYSPLLGLEIGLSGYTGEYDLAGNRINMGNLDVTWRSGKLELLGEVVLAQIDPGFVEGFADPTANTREAVPEGMRGFYAQANYHFIVAPLWEVFPDWLQEATFTAVLRYEGKDSNTGYQSASGDRRRLTFGLNFRPLEAYVLKTDYQLESHGLDGKRSAPDLWQGEFWEDVTFRFATSIAFLF